MVDTINPQTGKEDSFPTEPNQSTFYSGFNKPDDVHVNFLNQTPGQAPVENVTSSTETNPAQNIPTHQVYSKGQRDFRPVIFALIAGSITFVFVYLVTMAATGAVYKGKLKDEEDKLSFLNTELANIEGDVSPLELPKAVETPASQAETPAAPKVEQNKIETPAQTTSDVNGQG